jgi:hypothetical protein
MLVVMPLSTCLKVPPMRNTCAALFVASLALLTIGGDAVYADQVDDLLAGRRLEIDAPLTQEPAVNLAASRDPNASAVPPNRSEVPPSQGAVPQNALSQKSWELTLADPDQMRQTEIAPQGRNEENRSAPTGAISLVPEPSAIALAAAALVYFLIFFRRRYSF